MQSDQLKTIIDMLPFLIPLFLIQVVLIVIALLDLFKRENMKSNTRLIWVFVIILINIIGPIVYLAAGRKDKPVDSD
jgi:heme/copper-type cytochrome/quinol oxidase subunit 4